MEQLLKKIDDLCAGYPGEVGVSAIDLRTGATAVRLGRRVFASASTIKTPILIAAWQRIEAGRLSLDRHVAVPDGERVGGSGVLKELHDGVVVTFNDLLTLMIIVSDNTATNLIIDRVGMEAVNAACRRAGLQDTVLRRKVVGAPFYQRPDYSLEIDNLTTPADQALAYALIAAGAGLLPPPSRLSAPPSLPSTEPSPPPSQGEACDRLGVSPDGCAAMLDILFRQQNVDRIPALLPDGARVAHKGGTSPYVRHDAGLLFDGDVPLAALAVCTDSPPEHAVRPEHRVATVDLIRRIARAVWDQFAPAASRSSVSRSGSQG